MIKNKTLLFDNKKPKFKILKESINIVDIQGRSLIRKKLFEVYQKTQTFFLKDLILKLQAFLNKKISAKSFIEYSIKYGIGFMLYPDQNSENIICCFDPYLNLIIIPIYQNIIEGLKNNTLDIENYINLLEVCITHEDTHRQQFKKYSLYNKNYKYPDFSNTSLLTNKQIEYYNQIIEAQAYGRQLGCILKKRFPDESVNIIFQKIWENKLDFELLDIYKDSRISDRAFNKFFRALYNYLSGQEKGGKYK